MKPQSRNTQRSRVALISMSGVALAFCLTAFSAKADEWDKKTLLTIDEPMQVTDTVLQPGKYVFKLIDSQSERHIVEIYNADETHLINTVIAMPNYRIQPTGKSRFMMWETPAGATPALRAWFYPGDNFGQEFPYPKNSQQTTVTQTASVTPAPPAPAEPAPAAAPVAEVQAAPVQTVAPEPVREQPQPVEVAQNTPPPAPATFSQDSNQNSSVQSTPAELPKTGSPYPLFGFAGLILLGLGGLIRQTRSA